MPLNANIYRAYSGRSNMNEKKAWLSKFFIKSSFPISTKNARDLSASFSEVNKFCVSHYFSDLLIEFLLILPCKFRFGTYSISMVKQNCPWVLKHYIHSPQLKHFPSVLEIHPFFIYLKKKNLLCSKRTMWCIAKDSCMVHYCLLFGMMKSLPSIHTIQMIQIG